MWTKLSPPPTLWMYRQENFPYRISGDIISLRRWDTQITENIVTENNLVRTERTPLWRFSEIRNFTPSFKSYKRWQRYLPWNPCMIREFKVHMCFVTMVCKLAISLVKSMCIGYTCSCWNCSPTTFADDAKTDLQTKAGGTRDQGAVGTARPQLWSWVGWPPNFALGNQRHWRRFAIQGVS